MAEDWTSDPGSDFDPAEYEISEEGYSGEEEYEPEEIPAWIVGGMEEPWDSDPGSDLEEYLPSDDEPEEYEPEEDPEWVGGGTETDEAAAGGPALGGPTPVAPLPIEQLLYPRPQNLGPVPNREEGACTLAVPRGRAAILMLNARYVADIPRIQEGLERVADRMASRRRRLGWWPRTGELERRQNDLQALWEVAYQFRYAPSALLLAAVGWAALRPHHPWDAPLEPWDGQMVSLGIVLAALHAAEEELMTPS